MTQLWSSLTRSGSMKGEVRQLSELSWQARGHEDWRPGSGGPVSSSSFRVRISAEAAASKESGERGRLWPLSPQTQGRPPQPRLGSTQRLMPGFLVGAWSHLPQDPSASWRPRCSFVLSLQGPFLALVLFRTCERSGYRVIFHHT